MEEGYVVPVLEEHDIHRRRRLVQIMAPPFGNDGDRQEQRGSAPDPAGGNNSPPVPPDSALRLRRGVRTGRTGRLWSERGEGAFRLSAFGERQRGVVFRKLPLLRSVPNLFRSADSVQTCAAAPACGGRLLSVKGRTVVSKEGISRAGGPPSAFLPEWQEKIF